MGTVSVRPQIDPVEFSTFSGPWSQEGQMKSCEEFITLFPEKRNEVVHTSRVTASCLTSEAVVTDHGLGGSSSKHWFLTLLEAGTLEFRLQLGGFLVVALLATDSWFPVVHSQLRESQLWPLHLLTGTLIPSCAPPSGPHPNLITSQRPRLQKLSHKGPGLQCMSLGVTHAFYP